MRKFAPFSAGSTINKPSAPMPRWRSQRRAICALSNASFPSRLSSITKSFPAPFILVKVNIGRELLAPPGVGCKPGGEERASGRRLLRAHVMAAPLRYLGRDRIAHLAHLGDFFFVGSGQA